jgi:steroid 5-alpha reductase family enzyme
MPALKVTAVSLGFAAIHSFMTSNRCKTLFRGLFGETFTKRWYRLIFVFVSTVMMTGIYIFLATSGDELIYAFPASMKWPMRFVQVGGMFFGMGSLFVLNIGEYFGLSQVARYKDRDNRDQTILENVSIDGLSPLKLATTGVYSIVRHPIYLAGILMITFQPVVTGNWLTVMAIADLYFIAAAIKEERALRKFSEAGYTGYADRVPMFNLFAGVYRKYRHAVYGQGRRND